MSEGCIFSEEHGQRVCDWIEEYCHLYEGAKAGQKLELIPWQRDVLMRLFGWMYPDPDLKKYVRRFRRGGLWIPKKNGKTPFLAAVGLYMFIGDLEQGQKVYSAAKDGGQAMIAFKHAIAMVEMSPELNSACKINRGNSPSIHHPESRSEWRLVAGDNHKSQEGLNGSVMIDETHVVDSRLASVLEGAGISRHEPLHFEVSTAGNNPDGYGKSQWDYGRSIEKGDAYSRDFFFRSYHLPDDVTDDQITKDPAKYGEMCNPSWGYTIRPNEFVEKCKASHQKSIADFSNFKMYRLNVWQRSSSPWIRGDQWAACAGEYDWKTLSGPCVVGLDMSQTQDMTAIVQVVREGDQILIAPHFFLPEKRALDIAEGHHIALHEWARDGNLIITPGDTVDYSYIDKRMREINDACGVHMIIYDQRFADLITQGWSEGNHQIESIDCQRMAFPQTMAAYTGPCELFERHIMQKTLQHNNNPCMNWQIGNVQLKVDGHKGKRPVKPDGKEKTHFFIDGVVAAIMGIAGYINNEDEIICQDDDLIIYMG